VLGVIGLAIVLFCGGVVALIIWAVNEAENELDEFDSNRRGGPDNPIAVAEGEGFTIDGVDYSEGWRIAPPADEYSQGSIEGLTGENNREDESSESVSLKFTFVDGDTELGTVNCYSNGPISYGNSEELECNASGDLPSSYDDIEVSASY
jgi:hypothetical protein